MTRDIVFDLSSLTKALVTTTAIMLLVREGKIRLETASRASSRTSACTGRRTSRSASALALLGAAGVAAVLQGRREGREEGHDALLRAPRHPA
jgi:hypothetical protein